MGSGTSSDNIYERGGGRFGSGIRYLVRQILVGQGNNVQSLSKRVKKTTFQKERKKVEDCTKKTRGTWRGSEESLAGLERREGQEGQKVDGCSGLNLGRVEIKMKKTIY